eukprot:scaffold10220_cov148-Cylindrotheca_fusiformis.AAC.8
MRKLPPIDCDLMSCLVFAKKSTDSISGKRQPSGFPSMTGVQPHVQEQLQVHRSEFNAPSSLLGSNAIATTRSAGSYSNQSITMARSKYGDDERSHSSKKSSKKKSSKSSKSRREASDNDNPTLADLEARLNDEVDEEFFQDPRRFQTLHRVIDVLGMQMGTDDLAIQHNKTDYNIHKNTAYKELKEQQRVIEDAIEHLALMHAQDLNGSVVQVGRVARQFNDAVSQVRHLRKQVKEIQETLGAGNAPSAKEQANASAAAASAMSLRELWLKKLEAEAVLALLDKLDRIRAAPLQFDAYLRQHRIGAATIVVAQALDTMFSSDVSQVQALHKIMEQLMMRKQKAEEVVWELLMDVLFLRTGNGRAEVLAFGNYRKALDSDKGLQDATGGILAEFNLHE